MENSLQTELSSESEIIDLSSFADTKAISTLGMGDAWT